MNSSDVAKNLSFKWLSERVASLEKRVRDLEEQVAFSAEWEYRLTEAGMAEVKKAKA